MSVETWRAPGGIGTFIRDSNSNAALPNGAYKVGDGNLTPTILTGGGGSSPSSGSSSPSSGGGGGGGGGGGSSYKPTPGIQVITPVAAWRDMPTMLPAGYQSSVTTGPTGFMQMNVAAAAAVKSQRQQQKAANVWSNDPRVRSLEEKAWDIYVETGQWNTPEQAEFHKQAEAIRRGANPMYPGTPDGSIDPFLPPPSGDSLSGVLAKPNSILTMFGVGIFAVTILSFLRR